MKKRDLIRHELIGLKAEVIDSRNKANIGIIGKIVDESKFTIVVEHNNRQKRLFKNNITLRIDGIIIDGKVLVMRPKDRIKKVRRN